MLSVIICVSVPVCHRMHDDKTKWDSPHFLLITKEAIRCLEPLGIMYFSWENVLTIFLYFFSLSLLAQCYNRRCFFMRNVNCNLKRFPQPKTRTVKRRGISSSINQLHFYQFITSVFCPRAVIVNKKRIS